MEGVLQANYGECLIAMERWSDASRELEAALRTAREGDDRAREGEALKFLGVLERERGRLREACVKLDGALEIGRAIEDPLLVAEVLRERGELRRRQGRFSDALEDWQAAGEGFLALHAALDANRITARLEALLRQINGSGSDEEASA